MKKIRFKPINYIIRDKIFGSPRIYYFLLVLLVISFPIFTYPRIYGVDAFQVMWMANALRDGALFSDNTWLISPLSYFGYYPFSHRAIGIPVFLAFLIDFLNFCSCGAFGITEAILVFNIIIIIILYKSSRTLGDKLFEEEWSRFVFVAAILLSPNIINDTLMTVSTRIIITIVMIVLLNLILKLLSNENQNKFKTTIFLFFLLLVGALAHRLWMGTLITIILMIFTIFIRKYKKLQRLTMFSILPISTIAFFVGLIFFSVDPDKIWSPFFDNSTLIGLSINLTIDYALKAGLILLFFPVGVIITLYKLTILLKKSNNEKNSQLNNKNQHFLMKNFYLLLFMAPFLLMAPSFYAIVLFLPIVIIFSVQGLIYIKKFTSTISNKFNWIFPIFLLFLSAGYSLLYVEIYININLWYMFVLISISLLFYLFVIITFKYRNIFRSRSKVSFNSVKLHKGLEIFVIIISILIFTTTTIVGRNTGIDSNPYPWDNRYLTGEEIEIINYFQNEDVEGLIFCAAGIYVSERIAGVGFLPSIFDRVYDGKSLYYGFLSPEEVYVNTEFSLSEIERLHFFTFNKIFPIRAFRRSIINFNISVKGDLEVLISYKVQYIISIKEFFTEGQEIYLLIQSLPSSLSPVFSTEHLLVWKLF